MDEPSRRQPPVSMRRSMRMAVFEAITVAAMFACTEGYFVPLIKVVLGAPLAWMAYLTWVPQVVAVIIGPFAAQLIGSWGGARSVAIWLSFIQGMVLLALLVPLGLGASHTNAAVAVIGVTIFSALGVVVGIAWMSWMGGLVPSRVRSRYIAYRTRWFIAVKIGAALVFSGVVWLLPYDPSVEHASSIGIGLILLIGALSRMAASLFMAGQGEAPMRRTQERSASTQATSSQRISFTTYMWRFRERMMSRVTMVWALFHFGWFVAVPFFGPYMLAAEADGGLALANQPLKYWLLMWTSTVMRLLMFPVGAAVVKRLGPVATLRIMIPGLCLLPFGWAFLTDFWMLLLIVEVSSGILWSITECAIANLLFDAHPDQNVRARLIGHHLAACSLAMIAGAILGQYIIESRLTQICGFHSAFACVFVASGVLRIPALILAFSMLPTPPKLSPREWAGFLRELPGYELADETVRSALSILRITRR